MKRQYRVGDLVHIPQAVKLVHYDDDRTAQLTIPIRIQETDSPMVGIVTDVYTRPGYVGVYCGGNSWAIKMDSIYSLSKSEMNRK